MKLTGILLAGGKSRRMGTDKALLKFRGSMLLDHTLQVLDNLCQQVIISSENIQHEREGFLRVKDVYPQCGPISGIYSCMQHSGNTWNLILSVDTPNIEIDFLKALLELVDDRYDVIVPVHGKGKEPLIAIYHSRCGVFLKKAIDNSEYRMHSLLGTLRTKEYDCSDWLERYPRLFANLNTPTDLAKS